MRKLYINEIQEYADQFTSCRSLRDFEKLGIDTNLVQLQSLNPSYYTFKLKKKNGGYRTIEAPCNELKSLLKKFNKYLQCVYYINQSNSSYGYIITPKKMTSIKNILGNATTHLGCNYLLNVDFQDFFHQIDKQRIYRLFVGTPFYFEQKVAHIFSNLFTYKGRLPMGTPTSPNLSNFCTLGLDHKLEVWSNNNECKYSRFVDDLSFSSEALPFINDHYNQIKAICESNNFKINPNKVKYFNDDKTKKITGLLLRDTVDIEDDFYKQLDKDLKRMAALVEVATILKRRDCNEDISAFKQEIDGQINFIGMIEGYGSTQFNEYRRKLKKAMHPSEEVLSVRWMNYNYM